MFNYQGESIYWLSDANSDNQISNELRVILMTTNWNQYENRIQSFPFYQPPAVLLIIYPVVSVCLCVFDVCKQDISKKVIYESLQNLQQTAVYNTLELLLTFGAYHV